MRTRQKLFKENYNAEALVRTGLISKDTEGFEQGFKFYLGGYYSENVWPISGVSKTN